MSLLSLTAITLMLKSNTVIISKNFIPVICRQEVKYRLACENSTFQLNWTTLESKVLQITKRRLKLSSRAVVQPQVSMNGKVNKLLTLILHDFFFMLKEHSNDFHRKKINKI